MNIKDKVRIIDIKTSRLVNDVFVGNYKSKFKGHGIEFVDIREYENGDDIKHIDWNNTAKHSKTYIRKYKEYRQLKVIFLINISESMKFGIGKKLKIDTLTEILSILSFSSEKNGDLIGAFIYDEKGNTKYFSPKKGKSNILAILQFILGNYFDKDLGNNTKKNLFNIFDLNFKSTYSGKNNIKGINIAIDFIKKHKIKNFLIFSLTDEIDYLNYDIFKLIGVSNDFIYINIFDEFENELNYEGVFNFIQDGDTIEINTYNNYLKEKYIKYRNDKINLLTKKLRKFNIEHLVVNNNTNIFKYLLKFFKKKN